MLIFNRSTNIVRFTSYKKQLGEAQLAKTSDYGDTAATNVLQLETLQEPMYSKVNEKLKAKIEVERENNLLDL